MNILVFGGRVKTIVALHHVSKMRKGKIALSCCVAIVGQLEESHVTNKKLKCQEKGRRSFLLT
jgi:hypothetical protein